MLRRFGVGSGVTVIAVLIALVLPASRSLAAPPLSFTVHGVRVVASGAALIVNISLTCTDSNDVFIEASVTQQTSRGVQHGLTETAAKICDGAAHTVKFLIYPPAALVPPESLHAVYETGWTSQPVLLRLYAATAQGSVQQDKVVKVTPATPSNPAIAAVAARKANGAGVVVTMQVSCQHDVSADPGSPDLLLLNFTQVGAKKHVQQVTASMVAKCDNSPHTYTVPFAATVQPWVAASAFVEGDLCSVGSGYCPSYPRTIFRTVTVQP